MRYRFNRHIRAEEVRVIGVNGEHVGNIPTQEAVALAESQGLDLVEINPKAQPPVCRIVEYGQFKYQQEKEERMKRAHQKATEVKGIRISARISEHDRDTRLKQSVKFLSKGNKLKLELILRGRENAQKDRAADIVKSFIVSLKEYADIIVEQEVKRQGNKFTALVGGVVKKTDKKSPETDAEEASTD